jgi:hypothetical protein
VSLSFARRSEITFTGGSAEVPGHRMVQVAAGGLTAASGRAAPGAPRVNQVLELAARFIAGLGVPVTAGTPGDGGELDPEAAEVVLGLGTGRRALVRAAASVAGSAQIGGAQIGGA